MKLTNRLTDLLGIEHPIIQAPMAGEATPELAIAVANAGGLGGLGCSYLSVDEIEAGVARIRAGTDGAFNLNFFAHPEPRADAELDAATRARVAPFYAELGIAEVPERGMATCDTFAWEKVEALVELRPRVVSFHFGLPDLEMVRALQRAGIAVMSSATTVAEARRLDEAGVDVVIAQGWEAGGHHGSFEASADDVGVGLVALVPQVADAVGCPVVAAGGIGDGRGIAAALVLGAQGVQLGTAFLGCPESGTDDAYRAALRSARDDDTRLSSAFSGRPARTRNNRYVEAMAQARTSFPDYPTMYGFSLPLMEACAGGKASGFEFLLYGQAAPLNRELPAAELVARLVEETRAALGLTRDG